MLKTLLNLLPRDTDYPPRQAEIAWRLKVLRGQQYDHLAHDFHEEYGPGGQYIPLRNRRPSVRYGLPAMLVEDSTSLLFDEDHFPEIECEHAATRDGLRLLARDIGLCQAMLEASWVGSTGSVAILVSARARRAFVTVMDTQFLTPEWQPDAPDTLSRVTQRYKVKGSDLARMGYAIAALDLAATWWFQREWNQEEETWYQPVRVSDLNAVASGIADPLGTDPWWRLQDLPPGSRGPYVAARWLLVRDADRSVKHDLGFVPVVWVRNLPGGDETDGACTFVPVIETAIEIDYLLSQGGRGLKYSMDPTLAVKDPELSGEHAVGGGRVLRLQMEGDAKLLEISGAASSAVVDYVKNMRELALEAGHGNRTDPHRLVAAESGKAIELMHQSLIWLAARLRLTYGEGGLIELLEMLVRIAQVIPLETRRGKKVGPLDPHADVTLRWPLWFGQTPSDRLQGANALAVYRSSQLISQETGVKAAASDLDVEDVPAELARIRAETPPVPARPPGPPPLPKPIPAANAA